MRAEWPSPVLKQNSWLRRLILPWEGWRASPPILSSGLSLCAEGGSSAADFIAGLVVPMLRGRPWERRAMPGGQISMSPSSLVLTMERLHPVAKLSWRRESRGFSFQPPIRIPRPAARVRGFCGRREWRSAGDSCEKRPCLRTRPIFSGEITAGHGWC